MAILPHENVILHERTRAREFPLQINGLTNLRVCRASLGQPLTPGP